MKNKEIKPLTIELDNIKNTPGYPSKERIAKGPVAVIECIQEIPCNPCETICPNKAIIVGNPITNLPKFKFDDCDGCGKCMAICPGLAIFLINSKFSESEDSISIPYEFLPLPKKGKIVDAVDRNGNVVCEGRIIRIQNPRSFDKTAVVTFAIQKGNLDQVRNFKLIKEAR